MKYRPSEDERHIASWEGGTHSVGLSLILVNADPGVGPTLHRHAYEEVHALQAGKARFTLGEDEVEAEAGDVVVVPPETWHSFVALRPEKLVMVSIQHSPKFITEWATKP
jgi:mannose-6-phosphate isomerase-like protein (cupin superfamily)